jgi:hypothetical protein
MEFDDGKLMLNDTGKVQAVTWERILAHVPLEEFAAIVARSRLIGIVNWSLLGGVPGIWEGLIRDIFPALGGGTARRVYIDLSDPAKRADDDIAGAMDTLRRIDDAPGVSVTLGLNLAESQRIDRVVHARGYKDNSERPAPQEIREAAVRLREALGIDCVAIHPREGAAAADNSGSAWFDGPFTLRPNLSTGAGDHFNAGFACAQVLGLPLEQCLACGTGVSGAYVRDAESPTLDRLIAFLRALPEPER